MLISRVPEEEAGLSEVGRRRHDAGHDDAHEYRTASELFELMAKNQDFPPDEVESLTTRDLVLLYKNIDLGTKLMSDGEFKKISPNQYVETVVYEDLDSDSDLSEIYSSEDIHNVVSVNKERIELFNKPPSLEINTLCHKLGDLEIPSSEISLNKKFVFNELFLKDQHNALNKISTSEFAGSVLPASLLDYICCKRLEDNYNFYMENIIRHVKHTIDQLKRISNGDYLTDKAKEKWREGYDKNEAQTCNDNNTTVLSNTTIIPLYVERKTNGHATKWDDFVHTDIDIRSLSKILEKKIVVEVPKTICGSYKLFSKCCNDNLIISCTREIPDVIPEETDQSRVDLVLHLDRSDSGHVISNISSLIILQKKPGKENATDTLVLPYNGGDVIVVPLENDKKDRMTIMEIQSEQSYTDVEVHKPEEEILIPSISSGAFKDPGPSDLEVVSDKYSSIVSDFEIAESSGSYCSNNKKPDGPADNILAPDELKLTIQRLNMHTSLPEEEFEDCTSSAMNTSIKKNSPTRNRIKSPYENKSHLLEEKKRKKLLEIRQRRELKKLALSEKVNKQKLAKGVISPHNASSITKLSITNKSFYDSIYGHPGTTEHKQSKTKGKKEKNDSIPESCTENGESTSNNQKYINKSYYLDDAVTEMMYIKMKENEQKERDCDSQEQFPDKSSVLSTDINTNLKIFTQIITPSVANADAEAKASAERIQELGELVKSIEHSERHLEQKASCLNVENMLTENAPKDPMDNTMQRVNKENPKKVNTSAEFRKSIDKIYELINKLGKGESAETKLFKSKFTAVADRVNINGGGETSTIQCSDSGTSVKHHLTSSNPSCFSFEKANSEEIVKTKTIKKLPKVLPPSVVPKVIISTKSQTPKAGNSDAGEKVKNDRKKSSPNKFNTDNPLKAISQLLHDFDNVQKIRNKTATESKAEKKQEVPDTKVENRLIVKRPSRLENYLKDKEPPERSYKPNAPKDRGIKQPHTAEPSRFLTQSNHVEVNHGSKALKKKVVDIVDELKEARGEAVRGPSKLNARLNSLAQPKKSYVQAHIEEFQTKYGKTVVTDRLHKLTKSPPVQAEKTLTPKYKRKSDVSPPAKLSHLSPSFLEKSKKHPNLSNREAIPLHTKIQLAKQPNVVDSPDSLKKKMVAVESYVKNHYGRKSTSSTNDLFSDGQKSRVPFFPNDIDFLSFVSSHVEVSSTLGNKIHDIIDTMIASPSPPALPTECKVSRSNKEKIEADENSLSNKFLKKSSEKKCDADNDIDNVFTCTNQAHMLILPCDNQAQIRNQTQVMNLRREVIIGDTILEENESNTQATLQTPLTKHNKVKNSLHGHMPIGPIQKCLELKNMSLVPKRSVHQVMLLQAGDANSVLVKSAISQNVKDASNGKELGILPELSNLDWNFAQFPMQIATVGYSFPRFQHNIKCNSNSNTTSVINRSIITVGSEENKSSTVKSDKTSQCFKGGQSDTLPESATQVDVKELLATSGIFNSNNVIKDQYELLDLKNNNKIVTKKNETIGDSTLNHIKNTAEATTEALSMSKISTEMSQVTPHTEHGKTNKEHSIIKEETDTPAIEYTTSLDILAGLLNEIQKITTCQTQITTNGSDQDTAEQHVELESILKSAVALNDVEEEARNIISIASLDKLRHLESNPSIYSFFLSSNGDREYMDHKLTKLKPLFADKEVEAMKPAIEYVNRCTDVPSTFFPITVNHATDASNSLVGILSKPSSQSVYAFNDYPLHRNASLTSLKVIKYPKNTIKSTETQETSIECFAIQKICNDDTRKAFIVPTSRSSSKKQKNKKVNSGLEPILGMKGIDSDLDPMIRMKRDILVTMYSVLVLTVFAALSFPEILYRV